MKMSEIQMLRTLVNQRLTAAADEIFGLFERTIAEYETELCRQRKLLKAVFNPEVRLHRADVQQILVSTEQQECSTSLDQQNQPELPHIKEEQEELWTRQEEEKLQGLEEAHITGFTFTFVPVKSEVDEEENAQTSLLHQSQTEENSGAAYLKKGADEENSGRSEPARNFNPGNHLLPATHDKTLPFSEPEMDDGRYNCKVRDPQSGLNFLQNNEKPVTDMEFNTGKTSACSSECATNSEHMGHLQKQSRVQTGVKACSRSVCGKRQHWENSLTTRVRLHSEGKNFSCLVCKKNFKWKRDVMRHMKIHTGEKPFSCSICGIRFARKEHLKAHSVVHTREKPYSCSLCGKGFARRTHVSRHSTVHMKEKPFSCIVCNKSFTQLYNLKRHKCVGESNSRK